MTTCLECSSLSIDIKGHYEKYRNWKCRSSLDGRYLLLISSKTIISTTIDQVIAIEDERRVVRRCRKFPKTIVLPCEYQYLSALRSVYIYIYIYICTWFFFSISLWFYLHCRMFAESYSTARILIVICIGLFLWWIFVCVFLIGHILHTNGLRVIFVVPEMDSWSMWSPPSWIRKRTNILEYVQRNPYVSTQITSRSSVFRRSLI